MPDISFYITNPSFMPDISDYLGKPLVKKYKIIKKNNQDFYIKLNFYLKNNQQIVRATIHHYDKFLKFTV